MSWKALHIAGYGWSNRVASFKTAVALLLTYWSYFIISLSNRNSMDTNVSTGDIVRQIDRNIDWPMDRSQFIGFNGVSFDVRHAYMFCVGYSFLLKNRCTEDIECATGSNLHVVPIINMSFQYIQNVIPCVLSITYFEISSLINQIQQWHVLDSGWHIEPIEHVLMSWEQNNGSHAGNKQQ